MGSKNMCFFGEKTFKHGKLTKKYLGDRRNQALKVRKPTGIDREMLEERVHRWELSWGV